MNYRDFFKLINNRALQGAYLLYGDEEYIKEKAVKAVLDTVPAEMRAFNSAVLVDPPFPAVMENCETLPFFTDRRIVICRGTSQLENDEFYSYLEKLPAEAILLIVVKGALQERSVILKHFRKPGRDVLFSQLSTYDITDYCVRTASRQHVRLDSRTARFLAERVGTDMTAVNNELHKAIDAAGEGGCITPELVTECTTANTEYRVFEMLDKFTSGNVSQGMRALHSMLADENEALGIAAFLESRFKLMLEARLLLDSGLNADKAVSKMEGNKYANKKACIAAKKYSADELRSLIKKLSSVGYAKMNSGLKANELTEDIMLGFDW